MTRFARTLMAPVALAILVTFSLSADTRSGSSFSKPEMPTSQTAVAYQRIDLSGPWQFALDAADSGVRGQWFNQALRGRIRLPGVLQSQSYGDAISTKTPWVLSLYDRYWYLREDYKQYSAADNVKVPFLSQPPRHYLGAAWYQRDIQIPQYMQNRRVVLTLERPHWATTVWVDGQKIGSDMSLVAPHVYDLGTVSPG